MKNAKSKVQPGKLRIIAGKHRGRRLTFPALPGVRPTPDRVRETLFNWLTFTIEGANCLDLFAGSGALGLEAISRGAGSVTFVDRNQAIVNNLRDQIDLLKESAQFVQADVLEWLGRSTTTKYDLIFMDPPFNQNFIEPACRLLTTNGYLKQGCRIYLEAETSLQPLPVPDSWQIIKHKKAGQVQYCLCEPLITDSLE